MGLWHGFTDLISFSPDFNVDFHANESPNYVSTIGHFCTDDPAFWYARAWYTSYNRETKRGKLTWHF